MDGFINILKPTGMTSHDVVKVLRRILGVKKTGHTGTLDPMAVGVLPVGIGTATKITEYLDSDFKRYRCEMILGITTDTGDVWGETLETASKEAVEAVTPEAVYAFEKEYLGEMEQLPPMYSAVRIDGRRLYEYARSGQEEAVKKKIKPRLITIKELKIVSFKDGRIMFDVECSKGTYVRTICTEIGEKLGCGGAMSFLARTGSGAFTIENTVTFEELQNKIDSGGSWEELMVPIDLPIRNRARITLNPQLARKFVNGGHIRVSQLDFDHTAETDYYRVYNGDEFIAMAYINRETKKLVPHKVFFRDFNGGRE